MVILLWLLAGIAIFIAVSISQAATYYIDYVGGNDSNNRNGQGNAVEASPLHGGLQWYSHTHVPRTCLLFQCGRKQL